MSALYSHPDFPNTGPKDVNKELMNRVRSNPLRLLLPKHITNYIQALWTKKAQGQPVTFTDIFGMLIGETLIPGVRANHCCFHLMGLLILPFSYYSEVFQSSPYLKFMFNFLLPLVQCFTPSIFFPFFKFYFHVTMTIMMRWHLHPQSVSVND